MDCLSPKGIANPKTGESMRVRCGKCLPCRNSRAGSWTIRLIEQEKCSNDNKFVTLTLDEEHITYALNHPTLNKRDLQLFFKRLRKKYPEEKFKYYAVGEYGSNTKRPHYHMIIFRNKSGKTDFEWKVLGTWNNGFIHVGDVTTASIRYVAGYLEKGIYGEDLDEEIQREFSIMSKGLGEEYINKTKKYHEENNKFEYHTGGGKFTALPRYYREKMFSDEARRIYAEDIKEKYASNTPLQEENKYQALRDRIKAKQSLKNQRK